MSSKSDVEALQVTALGTLIVGVGGEPEGLIVMRSKRAVIAVVLSLPDRASNGRRFAGYGDGRELRRHVTSYCMPNANVCR